MGRLNFLTKYAEDGVHYDAGKENDKAIDKALNDESQHVRVAASKRLSK